MDLDRRARWSQVSRELALACNADGVITWSDDRATRLIGAAPGIALRSLAVPATEAKVDALLSRANLGSVAGWELSLVVGGVPATIVFAGRPGDDGSIELFGFVLPDGYGDTVRQLNGTMSEVIALNREISRQRKELSSRHEELTAAYRELDESTRGVLALHAELAERAEALGRSLASKSRVVAQASHELRAPLHAMLKLTHILLAEADGPLTGEQRRQVLFIRESADELSRLVHDVLELASTEAGTVPLRIAPFTLRDCFAALRGMVRPLVPSGSAVFVEIDTPADEIAFNTDEGKLSQILRNLVSNALKFTERGEIRVTARAEGPLAVVQVRDTGIGIAREDVDRIFEEFGQVEGPLQGPSRGTGLGLPLSRTLAGALGGTLTVDSTVGLGSTFTLIVPRVHPEARPVEQVRASR